MDHTIKLKKALNEEFLDKEMEVIRTLLMSILSFESRANKESDFYNWAKPFKKELQARRLLIAKYYKEQGGTISVSILEDKLPSEKNWPGLVRLVKTDGFEIN